MNFDVYVLLKLTRSRSRNLDIPAPAESSGPLRLRLHNTVLFLLLHFCTGLTSIFPLSFLVLPFLSHFPLFSLHFSPPHQKKRSAKAPPPLPGWSIFHYLHPCEFVFLLTLLKYLFFDYSESEKNF
jgi:hypothetical protein